MPCPRTPSKWDGLEVGLRVREDHVPRDPYVVAVLAAGLGDGLERPTLEGLQQIPDVLEGVEGVHVPVEASHADVEELAAVGDSWLLGLVDLLLEVESTPLEGLGYLLVGEAFLAKALHPGKPGLGELAPVEDLGPRVPPTNHGEGHPGLWAVISIVLDRLVYPELESQARRHLCPGASGAF